jgi:hypothetical protein
VEDMIVGRGEEGQILRDRKFSCRRRKGGTRNEIAGWRERKVVRLKDGHALLILRKSRSKRQPDQSHPTSPRNHFTP